MKFDVTSLGFIFPLKLVPCHCKNLQVPDNSQDFQFVTSLLRMMPFRLGDHIPHLSQDSSSFPMTAQMQTFNSVHFHFQKQSRKDGKSGAA